jgi:PPOX class probable F420-dependent enzyme
MYLSVEEEKMNQREHPFDVLEGHRYVNLRTFRKSGESVSTTVWFVLLGGRLYVTTDPDSGKMKRIRNDPRVVLTPSNAWGRPKGGSVEGIGRPVEEEDTSRAEQALRRKYRLILRLFELFGRGDIGRITLEIRSAE